VDLVAKDFGLLETSARAVEATIPLGQAAGEVYWAANRAGFGGG